MMRRAGGVVVLAALTPALPMADLQAAAQSEPEAYVESVEVNVVNVEVYVTDKKGNRVTGLGKDDFEIFEDRKPVAITNFFAVENGRVLTPVGAEPAPEEPEEVAPGIPALPDRRAKPELRPIPDEQKLHLVVYVDNFNIKPFNRNRVFRRLREFLRETLRADDRVMLVSYDRSLHIRVPFTADAERINRALFDLETVSGWGVHRENTRDDIIQALDEADQDYDVSMELRTYAEDIFNDLQFTIGAMEEFQGWLAGLPGRKAILYVSDGLPMVAGRELFDAAQKKFSGYSALAVMSEFDASRDFEQLAAKANTNRVTFYTIDAAGLRTYSSSSVENFGASTPGLSTFLDSTHISNLQSPLQFLAQETGGRAIINTNDVKDGLSRVAGDLETYYSLGYSPATSGDGRYHRIRVETKRKGLSVRHRDGYRSKTLDDRMQDGTLSALRFGYVKNPLEAEIEFGRPEPQEEGRHWVVPIEVRIPLNQVVLLPTAGQHEARLRLYVSALDERGEESPIAQMPIPIRVPEGHLEEAQHTTFRYELTLVMRAGPHQVAVGLRDEIGAEVSFLRKSVFVGS